MQDYMNERPVCSLPWLIFWLFVNLLVTLIFGTILGVLIGYSVHSFKLALTMTEMYITIQILAVLFLYPAAYIFMRWKWRKAGHSLKTVWGKKDTRIWFIVVTTVIGGLCALAWSMLRIGETGASA